VAVEVTVNNAKDSFGMPMQIAFDPKVVELVEVHHGGFLAGDQPAALVHRVDKEAARPSSPSTGRRDRKA
jgi:hypothetical protein